MRKYLIVSFLGGLLQAGSLFALVSFFHFSHVWWAFTIALLIMIWGEFQKFKVSDKSTESVRPGQYREYGFALMYIGLALYFG